MRSDQVLAVLPTRPPVGEEGEEVGCADGAVEVAQAVVGGHTMVDDDTIPFGDPGP